jgi:dTDP-4-amino-4,6-dideoxygalactose transaminase
MIPLVQPTLPDFDEVMREFRQVWESGQVTTGTFTRQFEAAVSAKLQVSHVVMVQSCTAGLMLVLRALKITGEVIVPAFTWTATAHAVMWNGLMPVFADITPGTYTLEPQAVAQAITPRTAAVIPVNVFGCPPDYEAYARMALDHGIHVVYDSAQGLGSRYRTSDGAWHYAGVFGEAEVFSLSPTKVVSAMEGGLVTTSNPDLASILRQMRDYGKAPDGEDIAWLGLSARVPEINAIVARHNFTQVDNLVSRRQKLVMTYKSALGSIPGLTFQELPETRFSSHNYFTLFINAGARHSRDETYEFLKKHGIQAKKYFYPALHQQQVYRGLGGPYIGKLPLTEEAAVTGLALPLYSHMTKEKILEVSNAVREYLG